MIGSLLTMNSFAQNICKQDLCNYCASRFVQVFRDLFTIKSIKWTYKTADVGIHTGGVTGSIPVPPTNFHHKYLFLLFFLDQLRKAGLPLSVENIRLCDRASRRTNTVYSFPKLAWSCELILNAFRKHTHRFNKYSYNQLVR
jgi:hypothetical protein